MGVEDEDLKYKMLYCDNIFCRVNTFEHGKYGNCPGCAHVGLEL